MDPWIRCVAPKGSGSSTWCAPSSAFEANANGNKSVSKLYVVGAKARKKYTVKFSCEMNYNDDGFLPKRFYPPTHPRDEFPLRSSLEESVDKLESKEVIKPVVRALLNKSMLSDAGKVKDYMSQPVICLHKNMKLKEAAEILLKHGISGAPVVEGFEHDSICKGRLVGIISLKDFLWKEMTPYSQEEDHLYKMPFFWDYICDGPMVKTLQTQITKMMSRTIDGLMNPNPVFIDEDASLYDAAELLLDRNIGRLPVLSSQRSSKKYGRGDGEEAENDKQLVGIITGKDILRHLILTL